MGRSGRALSGVLSPCIHSCSALATSNSYGVAFLASPDMRIDAVVGRQTNGAERRSADSIRELRCDGDEGLVP